MCQNAEMKFSVLVPVYNAEQYVDACVQSVLNQTYQNFELILVDDGSKDASGKLCDEFAEKYPFIKAFHKSNGGQLHTRQYAISKATGDYFVFLDADDTLRENALAIIKDKILAYRCDCLIYQLERVCEGQVVERAPHFADECITDKRELYRKCFLSSAYNSMCRKAVKASLLRNGPDCSAFFSVRFAEDLLQSIGILKNCEKAVFTDAVLYNYRVNLNSISFSGKNIETLTDFSVRNYTMEFLQQENVWTEADFVEYRGYCAELLCNGLFAICELNASKTEKVEHLRKIRSSQYYRNHLHGRKVRFSGKKRAVYALFEWNWLNLLVCILSICAKR